MSENNCEQSNQTDQIIRNITYNDVATKLLKDKFLLTALELHTELVESGRELRQLKDFFSNPGNFEIQSQELPNTRISRSESQVTLDSLDLTRFSEDGAGTDERVAVLEFELRKAKETINALRNNLTVATESETSTPDKGSLRQINVGTIKPHEQRALNFLINEYLLLNSYKLTSITFADENQNQDFDDWDDVGLNIAKPPELLTVYREGLKQSGTNSVSVTTQTDFETLENEENERKAKAMEGMIEDLKLNISKIEQECSELKAANQTLEKTNELLSIDLGKNRSKDSIGSDSPERFEMIDKNSSIFKKRDSITTLEDNISNSSFNPNDWTNLSMNHVIDSTHIEKHAAKENEISTVRCNKFIENLIGQEPFKSEVFNMCFIDIPQKVENEILNGIINNSVNMDSLVHILSKSLLRIIPNIILNKREEAIPLLISGVLLNSNSHERDQLLQQLFNLKKKPSTAERNMILTGINGIAKYSEQSLIENEILPQCWEQLSHKHVERRLLVAETCIVLMPYVSTQICNSLILSMFQQMLDDREELIRETVIKALSMLMAFCDDSDKYSQCEELVLNTLNDPNSNIVNLSTQILFPVLGEWSLSVGTLNSHLLKNLLHRLNNYLKDSEGSNKSSEKILRILNVLENLLPFLLMAVATHKKVISNVDKNKAIEMRPDLVKMCSTLTNPATFYKSELSVGAVLDQFEKYIGEVPNASWPELEWVVDIMIPDLLNNLNHIERTHHVLLHSFINLFSHICVVFGMNFTKAKIKPRLQTQIKNLEQILLNFNQFCPNLNIIPVYLVSVLSYCKEDEELSSLIKRFLCALPIYGAPVDCLEITVKRLCELGLQELVVASLWEGVMHQRQLVKAATANLFSVIINSCDKNLLNSKVTPALVTLASDSDVLVKTAAIPALGTLITDCNVEEIHDKVYMQIQTYLADPSLKENHTLLRQLIVTLGNIVNSCKASFRKEVILPQLSEFSSFMLQMSNQTRKVDMALALVEAFTNVVFSPFTKENCGAIIMPGLQCLETVVTENHSLVSHRDTVLSMIRECDNKSDPQGVHQQPHLDRSNSTNKLNMNQSVEEMRQRVSKMFNKPTAGSHKPNTLSNLQGIFKKK